MTQTSCLKSNSWVQNLNNIRYEEKFNNPHPPPTSLYPWITHTQTPGSSDTLTFGESDPLLHFAHPSLGDDHVARGSASSVRRSDDQMKVFLFFGDAHLRPIEMHGEAGSLRARKKVRRRHFSSSLEAVPPPYTFV